MTPFDKWITADEHMERFKDNCEGCYYWLSNNNYGRREVRCAYSNNWEEMKIPCKKRKEKKK